jgi:ATP-binding cassette subfamily F protein 3
MPPPRIVCTAQQSRFHSATIETGNEIDLKDVCISIGQNELLSGVHLRLKAGVRYALLGRNGAGKSTLLVALADKLIPGLSTSIRILLLSQVEDAARAGEKSGVSVLEHVIAGVWMVVLLNHSRTSRLMATQEISVEQSCSLNGMVRFYSSLRSAHSNT